MTPNDNHTDKPGSDGLTRSEMYKWLENYDRKWADGHERMRNALNRNTASMTDGFNSIRVAMDVHAADDRAVELRVHDLEQREKAAATMMTKRNLIAASFISFIIGPAAAWLFRWLAR